MLRHEPRFVPAIVQRAQIYATLKQCDRVREILRAERALVESGIGADLGFAEARCGEPAAVRKTLARWDTVRAQGQFIPALQTAAVYAGLGDSIKVFAHLQSALTEHDWQLIHLAPSPMFAAYRASPTFQSILRKVGMTTPGG